MINLHYSNGKVFVWNEEDVFKLRKDHRIVGSFVGIYPVKTCQAHSKWLPLQLLPEEAKLLIDKGAAQLVTIPEKCEDSSQIELFFAKRDKLCEEQIVLLKENRKKEILEKADVICKGKKRKLLETLEKKKKAQKTSDASNPSEEEKQLPTITVEENNSNSVEECSETDTSVKDGTESNPICESKSEADAEEMEIDRDAVIEAALAKIPELSKELCMVQLFTENPWKTTTPVENWKYPSTATEKLRYATFKDLWEKGYYLTPGKKFGGDFLVYGGDPIKFHSMYIVVCMNMTQKFQGFDLIVYGRLGHQVRKTVALASLNNDGTVDYISIDWQNEMI